MHYCGADYTPGGGAKRFYEWHYDHVRQLVPKDRLLEHVPQDGWEPLCKLLDVPVPDEPYPFVNEAAGFVDLHKQFWWGAFRKMVFKVGSPIVLAAGIWYLKDRNMLPFIGSLK